jgi:hypothetical protein
VGLPLSIFAAKTGGLSGVPVHLCRIGVIPRWYDSAHVAQHAQALTALLWCPCRVNGLALAVWIYASANISGGHLNPAVTISTLLCGESCHTQAVAHCEPAAQLRAAATCHCITLALGATKSRTVLCGAS